MLSTWSVRWSDWCRITRITVSPSYLSFIGFGICTLSKAYQHAPSLTGYALAKQFYELVAYLTFYPSFYFVLKLISAYLAQLLLFLQRPELPLHNNLS